MFMNLLIVSNYFTHLSYKKLLLVIVLLRRSFEQKNIAGQDMSGNLNLCFYCPLNM